MWIAISHYKNPVISQPVFHRMAQECLKFNTAHLANRRENITKEDRRAYLVELFMFEKFMDKFWNKSMLHS